MVLAVRCFVDRACRGRMDPLHRRSLEPSLSPEPVGTIHPTIHPRLLPAAKRGANKGCA
jgi:hypothetical protein